VGRTGHADLRLCTGFVPQYKEIVALGGALLEYLVDEIGTAETLRRLSDPIWFEAMASAMGFEWQFSGATTVTMRALAEAIKGKEETLGLWIVGGKGNNARTVNKVPEDLKEPDITTTKVDSALIQDGYQIYFHAVLWDEKQRWAVINQGMNTEKKLARRYHWNWEAGVFLNDVVNVAGNPEKIVLDLQTKQSEENRRAVMDILHDEPPQRIKYKILSLRRRPGQMTLATYFGEVEVQWMPYAFKIPSKINEEALRIAKDAESFLDIIRTPGMGPSTIRGLSFLAALVYGAPASWKDPVKYTYAFGTKAGKPWMVEREEMRRAAEFIRSAVSEAKIGNKTKKKAMKRLSRILEEDQRARTVIRT